MIGGIGYIDEETCYITYQQGLLVFKNNQRADQHSFLTVQDENFVSTPIPNSPEFLLMPIEGDALITYNYQTDKETNHLYHAQSGFSNIGFSPNGKHLIVKDEHSLKFIDWEQNKVAKNILHTRRYMYNHFGFYEYLSYPVISPAVGPDGRTSNFRENYIINTNTLEIAKEEKGNDSPNLWVSPDGKYYQHGIPDGDNFNIFDLNTKEVAFQFEGKRKLQFTPTSNRFYCNEYINRKSQTTFYDFDGENLEAKFATDQIIKGYYGDQPITYSADRSINICNWDENLSPQYTFSGMGGRHTNYLITSDPSQDLLVAITDRNQIFYWNVAEQKKIQELKTDEYKDKAISCAISPNGKKLLIATKGRRIQVYDIASNKLEGTLFMPAINTDDFLFYTPEFQQFDGTPNAIKQSFHFEQNGQPTPKTNLDQFMQPYLLKQVLSN